MIAKAVRCSPVFVKLWRYRTIEWIEGRRTISWSSLKNIWRCENCKQWSRYREMFDSVCQPKDRRHGKDRRR